MTSEIKVDTISEQTSANGVTIDGLTIKDGNIIGDVALAGTTPTFTIGDGGAEDAALIFDGNALDYYIGLDDSADNLIIGSGSTVGSNSLITIDSDGDFTLDSAGDIILDVGGGDIKLTNAGTNVGEINLNSNGGDIQLANKTQDKDITFHCNDGGGIITVLTLDGSAAGAATFNSSVAMTSFAATAASTITTADNSNTLTLSSTDADANPGPVLNYYRNSGSAADNDYIGRNIFTFNNDAPEIETALAQNVIMTDVSNGSEDVKYIHEQMTAGSIVDRFSISATEAVFNEASIDADFRVESNGNANMLFIDGGNDKVGIGTSSPSELLEISSSSDPAIKLNGGASGNPLIDFSQNGTQKAYIQYLDSGDLWTFQSDGGTRFLTGGSTERLKIDLEGNLVFNDGQNDCNFRIKSDNLADMLFVDAGNDRVGIGSDAPDYTFQVDAPSSVANYAANIRSLHTSTPYGLFVKFTSASPDGSDNQFYVAQDSGTTRFKVNSDGDVQNHDNSYGALSDERIKQDIRDSNSQWNDIKAIKVRNFKKKDDVRQYGDNAWEQIGVVAQELETVSPKLIRHNNPNASDILSDSSFGTLWTADDAETQDAVLYTSEDQEVIDGIKNVGDIKTSSTKQIGDIKEIKEQVKSVNYSVLYMKAIKALQEAQTRIEILETKVEALEG